MALADDYEHWARFFPAPVARAWRTFLAAIDSASGSDDDAIHDNVAAEINALSEITDPDGADVFIVEDADDSWNKYKISMSNITDDTAIHTDAAGEINQLDEKGTPVSADLLVIEDSAASNAKKKVQVGNLPGGGSGETNTASNQGSGTSIYYQKSGVDLQFNAIKSENNRLGVALDAGTHDVELTVNEGNIDHDNLTNTHSVYDYSDISGADSSTDVTAAELEELTDGSATTLHSHSGGASLEVFQTLKSGTQATTGSFADITGWAAASPSTSDISFNTTTGVVTFNTDGTYLISCWVKGDASSSNRCQIDLEMQYDSGGGYATVAGATDSQYALRNTTQRLGSVQINNFAHVVTTSSAPPNAKFRMKDIGVAANVYSDAARITILRIA